MIARTNGWWVFAPDALMNDTGRLPPAEVRGIILLEIFRRASEQKAHGA